MKLKKVMYYNPKTSRYMGSKVTLIEGDIIHCKDEYSEYTESLTNLKRLSKEPNPNWHGTENKPLIKLSYETK